MLLNKQFVSVAFKDRRSREGLLTYLWGTDCWLLRQGVIYDAKLFIFELVEVTQVGRGPQAKAKSFEFRPTKGRLFF
jgi:hypothetical protein